MSLLWARVASISPAADHIHPNVTHYRSGGIGHLPGDDERSTVGMVPTHVMQRYREHDGNQNPHGDRDRRIIDGIRADIREGRGIHEPLQLEHDPDNHWGSLGEGNHRLAAAAEEGVPHVPVRVHSRIRSLPSRAKARAAQGGTGGAPLTLATDFGHGDFPYTPPEIHPHHFHELAP